VNLPQDHLEFAEADDLAGVSSFYNEVGYCGGVHPDDRALVVRVNQTIIAAVRLCDEKNTLVLRGMYVAEKNRGRGVGSRLLESAAAAIGSSECWCIPYIHLTNFYSRVDFCVSEGQSIPSFLAERWEQYTASGQKVLVMHRPARMSKLLKVTYPTQQ